MNSSEQIVKSLISGLISEYSKLSAHEKHRKSLQSARNKRYYQRNRDKILAKQRIKNELYKKMIPNS